MSLEFWADAEGTNLLNPNRMHLPFYSAWSVPPRFVFSILHSATSHGFLSRFLELQEPQQIEKPATNNDPEETDDLEALLSAIEQPDGPTNEPCPRKSVSAADLKGWDDDNSEETLVFSQANRALVSSQRLVRRACRRSHSDGDHAPTQRVFTVMFSAGQKVLPHNRKPPCVDK